MKDIVVGYAYKNDAFYNTGLYEPETHPSSFVRRCLRPVKTSEIVLVLAVEGYEGILVVAEDGLVGEIMRSQFWRFLQVGLP
jgi:hypothetical protein